MLRFFVNTKLYDKKMLKNEVSINKEVITIWELFIKILDRLFDGKKPPEEMMVMEIFKELNNLTSKIFKMIKIPKVISEYKKKIFKDCFKVSALLNDIKLVKDFLKLWSKMSIKSIIENRKYSPPTHCDADLHKIKLWSIWLILLKIVKPVDVKPEIASK